jgi:hypothetical protein
MLLPLEYSISLWWVATPLWESDESELDIAVLAPQIDHPAAAEPDRMPSGEVNEGAARAGISSLAAQAFAQMIAPIAALPPVERNVIPDPAEAPSRASVRMVLKGYAWTAKPVWEDRLGTLWQSAVDVRRHDAARHREQRQLGSEPVSRTVPSSPELVGDIGAGFPQS